MSAYVCTDKHIATIARGFVRVTMPAASAEEQFAMAQNVANLLLAANIRSVNYRYDEDTEITPCDLSEAEERPLADLLALLTCWDYQSCERPDWDSDPVNKLGQQIHATLQANLAIRGRSTHPTDNLWSI